jgi:hypothetical protein
MPASAFRVLTPTERITLFADALLGARPDARPQTMTMPHQACPARLQTAVRQNEEVIPMNESTWVLLSGVTVGR